MAITRTRQKKHASGEELHALFYEVFALQRALSEVMDAVHEKAGLQTPQVKVLDALQQRGRATVPDVATALGVSRQFVQTICSELENRGLLAFADNPRHLRSKLVSLTEKGRNALNRFREREAAVIEKTLPMQNAERVADALKLIQTIRHCIQGGDPKL